MIKPGKTYDEVYESFRWEIPEFYNLGVCRRTPHDRHRQNHAERAQEARDAK